MLKPKLFTTLKDYTSKQFFADLSAGTIVGIVALPLAIAFGIASGVTPEKGLITAIIAGFLISFLGGKTEAGGAMKEKGTTHCSGPNIGGTNSSGFTALPGGCRQINSGMYFGNGIACTWWSGTEINAQTAWYCQLYFDQTSINRMAFDKSSGCSIRLIKD